MRKLLTLLFGFSLLSVMAQTNTTSFVKTYGGSSDEQSTKVIQTSNGDYFMLSTTESYGTGNKDFYVMKTNGLGAVSWEYTYGTTGNDVATNMIRTNDGGLLITGSTDGGGNGKVNALVLKLTSSGNIAWTRYIYNDSFSVANDAVESRYGGYVITGTAHDDSLDNNVFVASMSSTGNAFWTKSYGGVKDDEGMSIAEDGIGRLIVVGSTANDSVITGSSGDIDIQVLRLWSTGAFSWVKTYGTTDEDVALNVEIDAYDYYISGYSKGTALPNKSMFVMKVDSSATLGFTNGYGTFGDDEAHGFQLLPSGDFVVAGTINQSSTTGDFALINSNSSGAVISYNIWGGDSLDGLNVMSLATAPEGGFNVLANGKSFNNQSDVDLYLIKTALDGSTACQAKVDVVDQAGLNFSSSSFQYQETISNPASIGMTKASLSGTDSTLCCQLTAHIASDSIVMCDGDLVRLGQGAISGYIYTWTEVGGTWTSSSANPQVSPNEDTEYKLVVSESSGECVSDSATVYVVVNARLSGIDFARDSFFCEGDTVTVSAYPGMNSYQWAGDGYIKSGQTVQLSEQDTILLTIIDNVSCVYLDTVVVLEIPTPVFSLGPDTTVCENLPVTLTGPPNMADYKWNGTSSSNQTLVTSVQQYHTLEVTDSFGCTYSDQVLVQNRPFATFSLGPDTSICPGTTYTILGPGALTGYIWNDTASSNQNLIVSDAGTYHLTAYNSYLCPYSDTVEISLLATPAFNLGSDTGFCEGGSVLLTGPSGLKGYNWSGGSDQDTSSFFTQGDKWLTVTDDNGCQYTDSVFVEEFANPTITLGPDTVICIGKSLVLSPGSGFANYMWSNSAQTASITVTTKGTYSVTVTDNNGCSGAASVDVDTMTCGTESIHYLGAQRLSIYPNPASATLFFTTEGSLMGSLIRVTDVQGQLIHSEKIASHNYFLDVSQWSNGMYQVSIQKDGNQLYYRVIVNR